MKNIYVLLVQNQLTGVCFPNELNETERYFILYEVINTSKVYHCLENVKIQSRKIIQFFHQNKIK